MDEVFNENVKTSAAFVELADEVSELRNGQKEIKALIEDERKQNEIDFRHGSEKFKELSNELNEVRTEVEEMKSQITDGFRQVNQNLTNYKNEVKDERIEKLTRLLDSKDNDEKVAKNRKALFVQALAVLAVGGVFSFFWKTVTL